MSVFRSLQIFLAGAAFLVTILVTATSPARADGKMFAVQVADTTGAQIPDQSALICWENGIETLAIETRFVGRGTDFAWVVPLPSRPEVTPATKGTFPTLRAMFAPVVWSDGLGLSVPLALFSIAGIIIIYVRRGRAPLLIVVLLIIPFVLLPTLGKARSSRAPTIPGNPLVDQRIVGDFEVSTLESPDGAAVTSWLRTNNFHVSPNEETVITQHAREGWSFVATRLRRGADSAEPSTAHPLVFKFATPSPIYPMRLTGADATRDLSVELFVFGPSRATTDDFATNAAAPLNVIDIPYFRTIIPREDHINLAHKAVGVLSGKAAFGTRLTAVLSPAEMKRDIQLRWTDAATTGRRAYNGNGVAALATEAGLFAALCVLVVMGIAEHRRRAPRGSALAVGTLLGFLAGGAVVLAVPSVASVRVTSRNRAADTVLNRIVSGYDARLPLSDVRERVVAAISQYRGDSETAPMVLGDAPGQYDLRARDGIIWIIAHDAAGAESWTNLCVTDDPDSK